MIRQVLRGLGILMISSLVAVAGVIFWAQSSTLPAEEYTLLTQYY
jgi:hypothetical protein